jgi:hypothetical protein
LAVNLGIDVKIMFFTSLPFDYAGERSAQGLHGKMIILMSIALWAIYFIGSTVLQIPGPYIFILACFAVVSTLMGTIIGFWIVRRKIK